MVGKMVNGSGGGGSSSSGGPSSTTTSSFVGTSSGRMGRVVTYCCAVIAVALTLLVTNVWFSTERQSSLNSGGSRVRSSTSSSYLQTSNHPRAKEDGSSSTNIDDVVLVVIISDRKDGIIPTIGSILLATSQPVDVVLIGIHSINDQVRKHFGKRIHQFTSLSVSDVTDDLVSSANMQPIWMWPEWHTSIHNPKWINENTLHVGAWDHLPTHAHELNHVRFYLPHLSIFQQHRYFFFLDDDVLVRYDLSVLANEALADLAPAHGLIGPCNIWTWNSDCLHFEFQSQKDHILDMPSLYGDRDVCKTESEQHCVPANYWDFVHGLLPQRGSYQHAWNFGFSLFALDNWRALDLTARYEKVMKESYRLHVFPETSLTFGLGVAYIAFAGAVQCWDEDQIKVRDGFGFIEYNRFEQTFGPNFLDTQVDIMHFTGPDKPWIAESRIEPWAVDPWLDMMQHEKLPIPKQLSTKPSNNLVTVLASEYTGVDYIMAKLDRHPEVCASGESDKPESGFPTDSLNPEGLEWLPTCSIKKGCTFAFINASIVEILANTTTGVPRRCTAEYDPTSNNDPLTIHLPRLCNFIKLLNNRYDPISLARMWIDAFVAEDKTLLACGCARGVKVKALKVPPEWITTYWDENKYSVKINVNNTKLFGSKVIRLKRRNLWARYKSMMIAVQTKIFLPSSPAEKKTQLDALSRAGNLTLDIHHLDWHMNYMQELDKAGDQWAADHGSEVLSLVYEDCMENSTVCLEQIYKFIGVNTSPRHKNIDDPYSAMFVEYDDMEESMEYVANAIEIREKMGLNGWDRYIAKESHRPIQLLLYNENEMLRNTRHYPGINATVFGSNPVEEGYGSKFKSAMAIMKHMPPDTVVVLGDLRTTWVNFPLGGINTTVSALTTFRSSFEDMAHEYPGAVFVSAQTYCCSNAMAQVSPGDLVDKSNARKGRSCRPGDKGCDWTVNSQTRAWQSFQTKLAKQRLTGSSDRAFLDADLIAGKAEDLMKLLAMADIQNTEDDQAVFTDIMYRNPNLVVLDYDQNLLAEPSIVAEHNSAHDCLVNPDSASAESSSHALFMRTPRSLQCQLRSKSSQLFPAFPSWGSEGIQINPIVEHIARVIAKEEMIVVRQDYRRSGDELEYPQGPEILYYFDAKGVWTSRLIRDRTDNTTFYARLKPSEELTLRAHSILMGESVETARWAALKRALRSGGSVPYWSWYGDYKICNKNNHGNESIPVFTTCARYDCDYAFPMPTYMTELDSQNSDDNWLGFFRESQNNFTWESKIRKVVWRGALSEADGDKIFTSIRWRAAKKVHELKSDLFDVGLTDIPSWVQGDKEIDLTPVGGLVEGLSPMTAFQRYVAILDMDGNSWSSRFGTLLCYNSVVIKVEPQYIEFFYAELKPWVHFIPVKDDLSDLETNVAWALDPDNELAVKSIISAANQWCSKTLVPEELARDLLDVLESYVGQLDRADPNWQSVWNEKRKQLSKPSSEFDLIRLL